MLAEWPLIPEKAFLFFPQPLSIKQGSGQSQRRKIFQNVEDQYDQFQKQKLSALDQSLKRNGVKEHQWFKIGNKLRYLQANKFKIDQTAKSIKQAIIWRDKNFNTSVNPLTPQILQQLKLGTGYICGRDREYRPIIILQFPKLKKCPLETVPSLLSFLLQFTINNLLVEGQIQNYIMLVNLENAGMGDREYINKIISFTSSTYRSRMFMMYLVNASTLIAASWDSVISKLVPESTAKKIRVSKKNQCQSMWDHVDRGVVEGKYGGTLGEVKNGSFWPVSKDVVLVGGRAERYQISKEEYLRKYSNGELKNRKIKASLVSGYEIKTLSVKKQDVAVINSAKDQVQNSKNQIETKKQTQNNKNEPTFQKEVLPPILKRTFKLFFQDLRFRIVLQNSHARL